MPWKGHGVGKKEKMKQISLIVFFSLCFIPSFSQGSLEVVADSQLYEVMRIRYERKKAADARPDTLQVQGYRVQIFFGNDRKKAYAIKDKAIKMFPEQGGGSVCSLSISKLQSKSR